MSRRLFVTIGTVGSLTALANVMVAVKDLAVAHRFGVSDAVDAFVFASILSMFVSSVVGNSFNAALIPTYLKVKEYGGAEEAQRLLSTTLVWAIALLMAVSVLLGLAFPVVVSVLKTDFNPEKLAMARSMFLILLLIIVPRGVTMIYAAVLNSGDKYALAAAVPAITPLCMLAAMLAFGRWIGIYSLCFSMVLGMVFEVVVLGRGLRRSKLPIWPRWYGMDEPAKQVVRQYVPMIAGSCLSSSTMIVDQTFAATCGSGSLSALSYGNKVIAFVLGICTTAVSTAILPHFCLLVNRKDWQGIRHSLFLNVRLVLAATVVITAILYFESEPIVRLLFQRGAFHASDTRLVAQVQSMYALQIPFYVTGILIVRLISSLQGNSILMWGAGINVVVNVILDYVLMKRMGVAGIALSNTGVYIVAIAFLWIALNKQMARLRAGEPDGR